MGFPLTTMLDQFDKVCAKKFGRSYDFKKLEKNFEQLRRGERWLVAKDVSTIFQETNTPFARYWSRPDDKTLDIVLRAKRLRLALVDNNVRPLVVSLLECFHNLGTASLVLRFVHPQRFGVFSTPVVHLLQVSRANTLDLYIDYCDELATWASHFQLSSVAQTEMALWAYAELTKVSETDVKVRDLRKEFEEDYWIQRRRVGQVLRPFLRHYGRLQLAQILLDEDPILAGKIAGEEYERLLDVASQRLRGKAIGVENRATEMFIDELEARGLVRFEDKSELKRIWHIRNRVVHPTGQRPEREQVSVMIDAIERICVGWEKLPSTRKR